MSKQVKRHNASGENYALLQDRVLVSQGHKQLYGTQVRLDLKHIMLNHFRFRILFMSIYDERQLG
jgi:hypothetical protein